MRSAHPANLTGRVLIVDPDVALAGLYAGLIDTHCPALRVDVCLPDQTTLIEDNAGGADLAIVCCGSNPATCLDSLRSLLTHRACLNVLVLIPADRPELADAAMLAGAADVLLRAPGYLDQIAACVRKNVLLARARTPARMRSKSLQHALRASMATADELRAELATAHAHRPLAAAPALGAIRITRPLAPARVQVVPSLAAQAA